MVPLSCGYVETGCFLFCWRHAGPVPALGRIGEIPVALSYHSYEEYQVFLARAKRGYRRNYSRLEDALQASGQLILPAPIILTRDGAGLLFSGYRRLCLGWNYGMVPYVWLVTVPRFRNQRKNLEYYFMVHLSNISKQHGSQILFRDASFQILPGSRSGLVGPNGAGKTTVFRIMAEEEFDAGEIQKGRIVGYFSQDVGAMSGRSALQEVMSASGTVDGGRDAGDGGGHGPAEVGRGNGGSAGALR